jgi:hypothetical protein
VKSFDLAKLAAVQGGEYVLAAKDLHTEACYLVYGFLQSGKGDRLIQPGKGYEEILCAITGALVMKLARGEVILEQGHAVHINSTDSFYISNRNNNTILYVIAGGRSESDLS